jgi:hypothetical protein
MPGALYSICMGLFVLNYTVTKFNRMINYLDPYITITDEATDFKNIGELSL